MEKNYIYENEFIYINFNCFKVLNIIIVLVIFFLNNLILMDVILI